MGDLRSALRDIQSQVRARPDSLERIHAEYRRQDRSRRFAAGTVASIVAAAGILVATQLLTFGGSVVPAAPRIDEANVSRLAPAWQLRFEGAGASAPAVADGVLYASSTDGKLFALDARTGEVRWVGITPIGSTTTPVVADGTVLVEASGELLAFDVACAEGGATCAPRWTATTGGVNLASPTAADGVAYVVSSPGGVSAFPIACDGPCEPTWTSHHLTGQVAHPPTVADGVIWDSSRHTLFAFPASCTSRCPALVRGVPDGVDLSSGPTLAAGVLYVGAADGRLYALPASCAVGIGCSPLWRSQPAGGGVVGEPVVAGGRVFVGSNDGRLYAFPTSCGSAGATCSPEWVGRTGGPIGERPVASGALVYVSSTDGTLSVFPNSCATACRPLSVTTIGALPASPAVWAGRVVYTMSADGIVTAYTVGGASI